MHHRKLILLIVVISVIHVSAIRVDTGIETSTKKSESSDNPKAEALTLVVHKLPHGAKLRPVRVIERSDDVVHVYHTSRPKRNRPTSRKRRPSSNQFRSKIKSASNFGGFKDYGSETRFPTFPGNNFGEPPRASNKFKNGPPATLQSFNSYSKQGSRPRKPTYGPPPSYNNFDTFHQSVDPSLQFDNKVLQTAQQQQHNFPSHSIDTVEPSSSNFHINSADSFNDFKQPSRNNYQQQSINNVNNFQQVHPPVPQPIGNFPLESGSNFNSHKTSYGEIIRGTGANFLFTSNQTPNTISNANSNFPKLPNRYEIKDFSTPTRSNPNSGNSFLNEFSNFNDPTEIQNIPENNNNNNHNNHKNRFQSFNKFQNFDYDYKNNRNPQAHDSDDSEDEDEDDSISYHYTTTRRPRLTTSTTTTEAPTPLTKRPKKGAFGKRKRPTKISQSHTLDTDDLRDAFTESSDFHEVALNSDDFINFDSQRNNKRSPSTQQLHEIHSTLRAAKNQNNALRSALGDDFEILSIHKSLEKDPRVLNPFGFQRKQDQLANHQFSVGSALSFGPSAAPVMWSGDISNFPKNHRLS